VETAETDLHSVFVFQVRRDGKCFDACQAEQGLSIVGGSSMCGKASTLVPGPLSMCADEIGFEERGDRSKWKHRTRESEDHDLRGARKIVLINKPKQRQAARQQITELPNV
jgi:hypothetical protein